MNWQNCITLTKLHHPLWRNCMPGDLISWVRTFWFQHSTIYTFFNLKWISAQQIKENNFNFQLNPYVRMKYSACFVDVHRKRRYDEITSPYVILCNTLWLFMTRLQSSQRVMYFKKHVVHARNTLRFHTTRCIVPTYDLNGQPYSRACVCVFCMCLCVCWLVLCPGRSITRTKDV